MNDLTLLTALDYGEARGEGLDGMLGVASTAMNRVREQIWYGKTLKEVILKPKQFSCFNEDDPNKEMVDRIAEGEDLMDDPDVKRCYWIAMGVLAGYLSSNVGCANHYHVKGKTPPWASAMRYVCQVGNHLFYQQV